MVWEGENVLRYSTQYDGYNQPNEAAPGTIRGDFGVTVGKNIIHGSDSPESAVREIAIIL